MKILIISEKEIQNFPDSQWIYVGEKPEVYSKIEILFGKENAYIKPGEFYSYVICERKKIIQWIDANLVDQFYDRWQAVSFLKNPFMSDFVLHLLYLSYIQKDIRPDNIRKDQKNLVVVCDHRPFSKTLQDYLESNGYEVEVRGLGRNYIHATLNFLRLHVALISGTIKTCDKYFFSKIILGFQYGKKIRRLNPEILIDTYLQKNSIDQSGNYKERYFPGLYEYYEKNGFKVSFYPWLYVEGREYVDIYRKIKKASQTILVADYFLGFGDILKTAASCLYASVYKMKSRSLEYENIELVTLAGSLKREIAFYLFSAKVFQTIPARLRLQGIYPKLVIDWYENQPLDKACFMGFNAAYNRENPSCKIISMRQYLPIYNFFNLFCGAREVKEQAAPPESRVMGKGLIPGFAFYGSAEKFGTAAALRYRSVYEKTPPAAKKKTENIHKKAADKTLLVLLTHSHQESANILRLVMSSFQEISKIFKKIIIRPHPDIQLEDFVTTNGFEQLRNGKKIEWSKFSLVQDFEKSMLVISSGTSAALEAIVSGLPVIVVGERFKITMNPLEDIDEKFWRIVFDEDQLVSAVKQWWVKSDFTGKKHTDYCAKIKKKYFEEATEKNLKKFLDLMV